HHWRPCATLNVAAVLTVMVPFCVRNGYANSGVNGTLAVTVALPMGFRLEPPTAELVLRLKEVTVTVGLRHCWTSFGEASPLRWKPGMFWACRQMVFLALVSASVLSVPVVAAYSAASRVADSSVIQVWNTRAKSMVSPRKASITGRRRANSATDWPRPWRRKCRIGSGLMSRCRGLRRGGKVNIRVEISRTFSWGGVPGCTREGMTKGLCAAAPW